MGMVVALLAILTVLLLLAPVIVISLVTVPVTAVVTLKKLDASPLVRIIGYNYCMATIII